jgi:hypothetical protein
MTSSALEQRVVQLPESLSRELAALLPAKTLAFLRDTGVPEVVKFRGIEHVFKLDMLPRLDRRVFRIGTVDREWFEMAVERNTGYFGYTSTPDEKPWVFCNSSVAQFLECFAASERLFKLEQAKQIEWEARGEYLEREIRQIDPAVFEDENNIWSFLVEEVQYGVV